MFQYQTLELRNLTQESKNVRLKVNNFIESQKRKIKRTADNKVKQSRLIDTVPIAEILSGKNVRAWVSMIFT